jgi:hypothetical protein
MFHLQETQDDVIESDESYEDAARSGGRRPPRRQHDVDSAPIPLEEGSRRSIRETRGIGPERLETDEI